MDDREDDQSPLRPELPHHSALAVLLASFEAARHRVAQAEKALITDDVEVITIRARIPGALLPDAASQVPHIIELGAPPARAALERHPHLRDSSSTRR